MIQYMTSLSALIRIQVLVKKIWKIIKSQENKHKNNNKVDRKTRKNKQVKKKKKNMPKIYNKALKNAARMHVRTYSCSMFLLDSLDQRKNLPPNKQRKKWRSCIDWMTINWWKKLLQKYENKNK